MVQVGGKHQRPAIANVTQLDQHVPEAVALVRKLCFGADSFYLSANSVLMVRSGRPAHESAGKIAQRLGDVFH
jgi:hypothetical protein